MNQNANEKKYENKTQAQGCQMTKQGSKRDFVRTTQKTKKYNQKKQAQTRSSAENQSAWGEREGGILISMHGRKLYKALRSAGGRMRQTKHLTPSWLAVCGQHQSPWMFSISRCLRGGRWAEVGESLVKRRMHTPDRSTDAR